MHHSVTTLTSKEHCGLLGKISMAYSQELSTEMTNAKYVHHHIKPSDRGSVAWEQHIHTILQMDIALLARIVRKGVSHLVVVTD